MNRVYKLQFSKSSLELSSAYDNISDLEKEKMDDLSTDSFFDFDDKNGYICFLITTINEMKSYLNILNENLINCECKDLSDDVLTHKIDLSKDLSSNVDNKIQFSFFIDDIGEWIYDNLDINRILDRILEVGDTESLSDIEREFLKNYKK